ncbi:SGNH/GDSL hydrolase family protein [Nocardia niwae]|uniref:SGNH/GDSL hydrolase family protein n=1 Tax=Nocardia niwae TaxID=626084 RepID=UPI001FE01439|nr:SGNH/GDSL hydrolase family protein [Nocardia niwae]
MAADGHITVRQPAHRLRKNTVDRIFSCMEHIFTEATDPFCLNRADAVALLAGAPWGRYAVVGDSLSAGVGDPTPGYRDQGWSDRLAAILLAVRPDLEYLNVSQVGATTAQTLENQADRLVEFGPDLLHVPCGANDIARRKPDFGEIERTLRRMYDLAKGTGALLTTFTLGRAYVVPAFPDWPERITAINEIVRGLAAEYGALVVDMWDHPVNDRDNLVSADRIHFSTSGQAVMAAEMVKTLAGALGRTPTNEVFHRGK